MNYAGLSSPVACSNGFWVSSAVPICDYVVDGQNGRDLAWSAYDDSAAVSWSCSSSGVGLASVHWTLLSNTSLTSVLSRRLVVTDGRGAGVARALVIPGEGYFSRIEVVNVLGISRTFQTDGFRIDITRPLLHIISIGSSGAGIPRFSSNVSFLSAAWSCKDPESPTTAKWRLVDAITRRQITAWNTATSNALVEAQVPLAHSVLYSFQVMCINEASLSTTKSSTPILVDATAPVVDEAPFLSCVAVETFTSESQNVSMAQFECEIQWNDIPPKDYESGIASISLELTRVEPEGKPSVVLMESELDVPITKFERLRLAVGANYSARVHCWNGAGTATVLRLNRITADVPVLRAGKVLDGTGPSDADFQTDETSIHAQCSGFSDSSGKPIDLEWSAGTSLTLQDIVAWTPLESQEACCHAFGLALPSSQRIFVTVRARNSIGSQAIASSDGVVIVPGIPTITSIDVELSDGTPRFDFRVSNGVPISEFWLQIGSQPSMQDIVPWTQVSPYQVANTSSYYILLEDLGSLPSDARILWPSIEIRNAAGLDTHLAAKRGIAVTGFSSVVDMGLTAELQHYQCDSSNSYCFAEAIKLRWKPYEADDIYTLRYTACFELLNGTELSCQTTRSETSLLTFDTSNPALQEGRACVSAFRQTGPPYRTCTDRLILTLPRPSCGWNATAIDMQQHCRSIAGNGSDSESLLLIWVVVTWTECLDPTYNVSYEVSIKKNERQEVQWIDVGQEKSVSFQMQQSNLQGAVVFALRSSVNGEIFSSTLSRSFVLDCSPPEVGPASLVYDHPGYLTRKQGFFAYWPSPKDADSGISSCQWALCQTNTGIYASKCSTLNEIDVGLEVTEVLDGSTHLMNGNRYSVLVQCTNFAGLTAKHESQSLLVVHSVPRVGTLLFGSKCGTSPYVQSLRSVVACWPEARFGYAQSGWSSWCIGTSDSECDILPWIDVGWKKRASVSEVSAFVASVEPSSVFISVKVTNIAGASGTTTARLMLDLVDPEPGSVSVSGSNSIPCAGAATTDPGCSTQDQDLAVQFCIDSCRAHNPKKPCGMAFCNNGGKCSMSPSSCACGGGIVQTASFDQDATGLCSDGNAPRVIPPQQCMTVDWEGFTDNVGIHEYEISLLKQGLTRDNALWIEIVDGLQSSTTICDVYMDPLTVFHIEVIARDAAGRTAAVTLPILAGAISVVPLDIQIHTEFISPSIPLEFSYSTPTFIFRTSAVFWRI
eukprot:560453-Rhodomonas_salina.1